MLFHWKTNYSHTMDCLPNDIIYKIYGLVHTMNLKEVHEELEQKFQDRLFDAEALLVFFEQHSLDILDPTESTSILVAMRNEGYMDNHTLYMRCATMIDNFFFRGYRIMFDKEIIEAMSDYEVNLTGIFDKYEYYLPDARRLLDNIEEWRRENVN